MCTVFSERNNSLFVAKSYDNFVNHGMIYINKENIYKTSLVMPGEKKLDWKSVYGSITFSQSGKGMPVNGMNEKGLVVEQATLPGTEYLPKDDRPEISCLEAIQYILDMCSSTNEAINAFQNFRIEKMSWVMHYYICDNEGKKAIIEFINGIMNVYTDDEIDIPLITNTSYQISVDKSYIKNIELLNKYQKNSVERNNIVTDILKERKNISIYQYFEILDRVQRVDTVWKCVYDIKNLSIYFRSIYNKKIQKIEFGKYFFTNDSPSLLLDLKNTGDEIHFEPYSREKNRENIEEFYNNQVIIKMMNLPSSDFVIAALDAHTNMIETNTINVNG
jgi:penicillin V acylase-like amidase (Ntn superfamily)